MTVAFRELLRRPRSFVAAVAILTLLGSLLMLLGGLLDGLISGSTNAVLAQRSDLLVFSSSANTKFEQSRVDASVAATIADVEGVTDTGELELVKLGARLPGSGPRELEAVVFFGFEGPVRGIEAMPGSGEVVADSTLRDQGVDVGDRITVGPARSPLTVTGFTSDATFGLAPTLWGSLDTWRDVVAANKPQALLADGVSQVLTVQGSVAPARLADAIDQATGGATETLTPQGVIDADEAVQAQSSTFGGIIGTTVAIAVVVVALFFALLTAERTALYGVLKALGARSGSLFAGVVAQAVVLAIAASLIAAALATLLDVVLPPGSTPYSLTLGRVLTSSASLIAAAVIGSAFSLRRVLRIDPASALGGTT